MSDNDSIDYGPLAALIGVWRGGQGKDIAPEPDGTETHPYYETITFEACGDVTNAEEQVLSVLHYRQIVTRMSDDKVFHDQTGYWMWDPKTNIVMQSLTIPRGLSLLAGGEVSQADGDEVILTVESGSENPDWQIAQSTFMQEKARTTHYQHRLKVKGDHLSYAETTIVDIYGRTFEHTDENTLSRVSNS